MDLTQLVQFSMLKKFDSISKGTVLHGESAKMPFRGAHWSHLRKQSNLNVLTYFVWAIALDEMIMCADFR